MSGSNSPSPDKTPPAPRSFGALLRRQRILAGLTQEALAERAGLSTRAISALESGSNRSPQPGTLDLLAEALQLSAEERAQFEAAARRAKLEELPTSAPPLPTASFTTLSQDHALQTLATPGEQNGDARLPEAGKPDTTQSEQHAGQESAPPQRKAPLPARLQRKRVVLWLAALLVLVASGSGVGYLLKSGPIGPGPTPTPTPAHGYRYVPPTQSEIGGTITFSTLGFPDSTNPWFLSPLGVQDVADAFWGNPFVTSPTTTFLPDELMEVPTLANGDISRDGLTITMRLRPDLKWSDGQPLTADDFAYWLGVELDPATGISGGDNEHYELGYQHIASYQVQDARTLLLRYAKPFAFALLFLPWAAPQHVWSTIPNRDLGKHPEVTLYPTVTSGPFMLENPKSYVDGQSITMVPNPYYVSTTLHKSVLDRLIFTAYPDADSLISAFEARQTDFAENFDISSGDLLKVTGVPGLRVAPGVAYQHLNFNLSKPILQVYEVRKAIEEAIDRCGLIQQVFQTTSCASFGMDTTLPSPFPDYDPVIKAYDYNLTQARQDMQLAGWDCPGGVTCTKDGNPFPALQLAIRDDKVDRRQAAELIKQSLGELGIPILIKPYPPRLLLGLSYKEGGILATGQYDLGIWGDTYDLDDDFTFGTYFESSQIPSASNPNGQNAGRVNDPLIDADLTEGREKLDPAARTEIYKALQQELVQKVYFVPLWLLPNLALVNPLIVNYQDNILYQGNEWNMSDWFLENLS